MKIQGSLRMPAKVASAEGQANRARSIAQESLVRNESATGATGAAGQDTEITDRLIRLFPFEGVTAYPLAVTVATWFGSYGIESTSTKDQIADAAKNGQLALMIVTLIIAVGVAALRYRATQNDEGKPVVRAVIVALLAFLLYTATLGAFAYFEPAGFEIIRVSALSIVTLFFTAWLGATEKNLPKDPPTV
ncbi:MAG: hypothetical protein AAFZ11_12345 [Pseudomonadota bacterium]